jgi:hypothetical protein
MSKPQGLKQKQEKVIRVYSETYFRGETEKLPLPCFKVSKQQLLINLVKVGVDII